MRLDAVKLGLAFGIVYALVFFLMGLMGALFGWGGEMFRLVGGFYRGFTPTVAGALIGAVWGFVVGFVFFALAARVYNVLLGRS